MKWVTAIPPESNSMVGIDFETTGLDPSKDRIVEIGAARYEPGRGGLIRRMSVRLNPENVPIHPGASKANGFTDKQLMNVRETFRDVEEEFRAFTEDALIVAHRLPFEVEFWATECERAGVPPPRRAGQCTKVLAAMDGRSYGETSLPQVSEHLGVAERFPEVLHHKALPDAEQCTIVAHKLQRQYGRGRAGIVEAGKAHNQWRSDPANLDALTHNPLPDGQVRCYLEDGYGTLDDLKRIRRF